LWLETQSFRYHAICCDFALVIWQKRSEGQHTHQSTTLHCSRRGDYEGMERNSGREKRAKDMIIVPPEMKNKVR
jgi:hypothetical protein